MKSIRNVDVLYTIHEKSRVLEECICRVESACDTGHFESVDSALRTKPELRAALGAYIRQMLALLGMLTPQAYSTASLDVRDVQDLLQALQWEPDRVSAFWPDLCDACRTLYRLSGEQLDIYVRLTQCALPGFVDSKNEEKTERNAGYLVVSHSGGGMLRQGTRKGIRRTPANRGMRAHRIVKSLDISEDVCHGMCP